MVGVELQRCLQAVQRFGKLSPLLVAPRLGHQLVSLQVGAQPGVCLRQTRLNRLVILVQAQGVLESLDRFPEQPLPQLRFAFRQQRANALPDASLAGLLPNLIAKLARFPIPRIELDHLQQLHLRRF